MRPLVAAAAALVTTLIALSGHSWIKCMRDLRVVLHQHVAAAKRRGVIHLRKNRTVAVRLDPHGPTEWPVGRREIHA